MTQNCVLQTVAAVRQDFSVKHFPGAAEKAVSEGLSGLFALFVCEGFCLVFSFFFLKKKKKNKI